MAAVVSRRAGARAVLAAGALLLGPVLLAGPAYADTASPTPIATEPPGGATCLPGTSASCAQDQGVSPAAATASSTATAPATGAPTPTPTPTTVTTAPASATAAPVVTTLPSTGAPATLAHTGAGSAGGWGYAGTALLLGGSVLVLAARRPRPAAQR